MSKKFYLTKEGLEKIKKEYQELEKVRSAKIKGEPVGGRFAFEDDMDILESKIAQMEDVIKNAELIRKPPKKKQEIVDLGAQVQVEVDGQIDEFTIVGSLETNPDIGRISNESPIGRALLGRRKGEEVIIGSPTKVTYKIVDVRYPPL